MLKFTTHCRVLQRLCPNTCWLRCSAEESQPSTEFFLVGLRYTNSVRGKEGLAGLDSPRQKGGKFHGSVGLSPNRQGRHYGASRISQMANAHMQCGSVVWRGWRQGGLLVCFTKLRGFLCFLDFCPRVAQRYCAIENEFAAGRVIVHGEITLSEKLVAVSRRRARKAGFDAA